MNAVYTCPKLQKWTYFLLKKKGRNNKLYKIVSDFIFVNLKVCKKVL